HHRAVRCAVTGAVQGQRNRTGGVAVPDVVADGAGCRAGGATVEGVRVEPAHDHPLDPLAGREPDVAHPAGRAVEGVDQVGTFLGGECEVGCPLVQHGHRLDTGPVNREVVPAC